MSKISTVARDLFKELRDKHTEAEMSTVNNWIESTSPAKEDGNKEWRNIPLFLTRAGDELKKTFCVMLRKAMTAKDFSAFGGGEVEAKQEAEVEPEVEAKAPAKDEPKAPAKDEPKAPAKDEPKAPAKDATDAKIQANLGGASDVFLTGLNALIDARIEARVDDITDRMFSIQSRMAEKEGTSISEERAREIIKEELKATLSQAFG